MFENVKAPFKCHSMYRGQIDGFHTNEDGKTVTVVFAGSRETPESMLVQRQDPDFEPEEVQQAFSTIHADINNCA